MPQKLIYFGSEGFDEAVYALFVMLAAAAEAYTVSARDAQHLHTAIRHDMVERWCEEYAEELVGKWEYKKDEQILSCTLPDEAGSFLKLIQRNKTPRHPGGVWIFLSTEFGTFMNEHLIRRLADILPDPRRYRVVEDSQRFTPMALALYFSQMRQPEAFED